MKKQVILFKAHIIDFQILREFENIKKACAVLNYDIFFLFDNSKDDFNIQDKNVFLYTIDDYKNSGYALVNEEKIPKGRNLLWFHADYPILFFYNKNKQYDYYWQIEFDVRFNGDWKFFLSKLDNLECDLISTNIKTKKQFKDWNMWGSHNIQCEENKLISCSFPIVRLSNSALQLIDSKYRSGTVGYCEISCPTILLEKGLKMYDISKNFYNKFTFQFRHPVSYFIYNIIKKIPIFKNKLFHPVRNTSTFDLMYSLCNVEYVTGKIGKKIKRISPKLYSSLKPYFPDKN